MEGSWGSNFGKRFNGWWFQPIYGKYAREIGSFPQVGVKTYLKPPTEFKGEIQKVVN